MMRQLSRNHLMFEVIYDAPTFAKSLERSHAQCMCHCCQPVLPSTCRGAVKKGKDRKQEPTELRNKVKVSMRDVGGDL